MSKQAITEKMGVHNEWYAQASKQTLETLPFFLKHLMEDYEHDYGTICHAISAGAVATAWAMNSHENGGITGFQAGCVMWEFIKHWNRTGNKTGLKLVDYDNMLYPQYEKQFSKIISRDTWKAIQREAQSSLDKKEDHHVHMDVRHHWERIVAGYIPFGYKLEESKEEEEEEDHGNDK
jgi:hypothetical protein